MDFNVTNGWKYYWHDLRNEKEIFSRCQFSVGSVIWGCFTYNGVGSVAFVSSKMNSEAYQSVLASHLLPNAEFLAGKIGNISKTMHLSIRLTIQKIGSKSTMLRF